MHLSFLGTMSLAAARGFLHQRDWKLPVIATDYEIGTTVVLLHDLMFEVVSDQERCASRLISHFITGEQDVAPRTDTIIMIVQREQPPLLAQMLAGGGLTATRIRT